MWPVAPVMRTSVELLEAIGRMERSMARGVVVGVFLFRANGVLLLVGWLVGWLATFAKPQPVGTFFGL